MKKILLGSQSPRRKQILEFFNLPFHQVVSHFNEDLIPANGNPAVYAAKLAAGKAEALVSKYPNEIILTADTVVYLNGKIYNKPKDLKEGALFLKELGGHWHTVHTEIHLRYKDQKFADGEETKLKFHRLTDKQIAAFHQYVDVLDKAGGYAIEGCGQLILEKMEGCYYNVLGLPVNALSRLLLNVGIDLWEHMRPLR
jgi:septum formation protein